MAKTYLKASAKARDTQFGQIIKLGVKADDLIAFAREHVNSRGYLNLDIVARKEVGQYGDTHSVALDDYVKGSGQSAPSPRADHSGPVADSDYPF
jgi:hypothetical protein